MFRGFSSPDSLRALRIRTLEMKTRREFLQMASLAIASTRVAATGFNGFSGPLCLFSKHLPALSWDDLAIQVKKAGFDGVDLTVRSKGHVLPERVAEDLPKAVRAIRTRGLQVPMITTELTSASHPSAAPVFETAGKLEIPFCKPGYWKYQFVDVRRELSQFASEFRPLVQLAKQAGVQIGFHNHEGNLGAPLWDVAGVIDALDEKTAGYYFDVRHAVVEGGGAGWKAAFNLIAPRLKMIAVKDFYWEKRAAGWKIVDCPLGQGMVDWKAYCTMLKQARFHGPVSVHLEYEIAGATPAAKQDQTLTAAQRDLNFIRARLDEAYAI
jgi:L-ribulose-5-phosphate 3-epimerase